MDNLGHRKTVVIYPMDAYGHIHPVMYIAKEMVDRGHRVIVMSTRKASWAPKLQKMGLEVVHCVDEPIQESETDFTKMIKNKMVDDPIEMFSQICSKDGMIQMHLNDLYELHEVVEQKLRSLKPDLILVDLLLSLPCIANAGCPYATLYPAGPAGVYNELEENCTSMMGIPTDKMSPETTRLYKKLWQPIKDMIVDFYAQNGIDLSNIDKTRTYHLGLDSPLLNFYLGPRELSYGNTGKFKPLPPTWVNLEHTIKQLPPDQNGLEFEEPESLRNLPGKLIYISLGTVASGDPAVINRILPMLSRSPNKFIVSMGALADQVKLYPNMWGASFVDQKAVLKKVDMFITHGGHNSTIEAFYFGVPSIIVLPAFGDQLDLAQRVEECGFGKRLNTFTCSEQELLGAIDSQLANVEAHKKMRIIGERLRSIDYPSIAADELEKLLF